MAVTYVNADGGSVSVLPHHGEQRSVAAAVVCTAYTTGGIVIAPGDLGFTHIDSIISTATITGAVTAPNVQAGVWTVLVFSTYAGEVGNGTDLSALPFTILVSGK